LGSTAGLSLVVSARILQKLCSHQSFLRFSIKVR
jgi:hypothetical protein